MSTPLDMASAELRYSQADAYFLAAFQEIVMKEGGYVDDPFDSGGKTRYGITERVARAHGYKGAMRKLSLQTAERIYKAAYWHPLELGEISLIDANVAFKLFDIAVNMGTHRAGVFLQRCLNVFNDRERHYKDIAEDGAVGPKTIAALYAYFGVRPKDGAEVLVRSLNCLQGAFYIDLAERRQKAERFVFGWMKNRVHAL